MTYISIQQRGAAVVALREVERTAAHLRTRLAGDTDELDDDLRRAVERVAHLADSLHAMLLAPPESERAALFAASLADVVRNTRDNETERED